MMESRVCRICGKVFTPRGYKQQVCNDLHYAPCVICGTEIPYRSHHPQTCSKACKGRLKSMKLKGRPVVTSPEDREKAMRSKLLKYGTYSGITRSTKKEEHIREVFNELSMTKSVEDFNVYAELFSNLLNSFEIPFQRNFELEGYDFLPYAFVYDFLLTPEGQNPIVVDLKPTMTNNLIVCTNDPRDESLKMMYARDKGYRAMVIYDWDNLTRIITQLYFSSHPKCPSDKFYIKRISLEEADVFSMMYRTGMGKMHNKNTKRVAYAIITEQEEILEEIIVKEQTHKNARYKYMIEEHVRNPEYLVASSLNLLCREFAKDFMEPENIVALGYKVDMSKADIAMLKAAGFRMDDSNGCEIVWSKGSKAAFDESVVNRGYFNYFNKKNPTGEKIDAQRQMLIDGWLPIFSLGMGVYEWRSDR